MDGLLTDSEGVGITVIQACGRQQGVEIPAQHVVATIGANRQWSASFYRGLYPTLDTERLFNDFEKEMNRLARAGQIPLKKGVRALLRHLAERNIPLYDESARRGVSRRSGASDLQFRQRQYHCRQCAWHSARMLGIGLHGQRHHLCSPHFS